MHLDRLRIAALLCAGLQIAACAHRGQAAEDGEEETAPATVEHLDGPQPTRITLTADAARRLDIQTEAIREVMVNGRLRKVMPYAALLYDTDGGTWTYTNPDSLVYLRNRVEVEYIEGDLAILLDGPPAGSTVVIVGAAELYGSELEFEEE